MPELPEVETTARFLRKCVLKKVVSRVRVRCMKSIAVPMVNEFRRTIRGAKIVGVGRRGKYIIINLLTPPGRKFDLLIHLRMSGSVSILSSSILQRSTRLLRRRVNPYGRDAACALDKHDHVIIYFSGGLEARFNDPRKFGRLYLVRGAELITGALGPEPLSPAFTFEAFKARVSRKKSAVKPLLLKQEVIAGIGNIYADESLWRAMIHPQTLINHIPPRRLKKLYGAIRKTLTEAIAANGTDAGDGVVDGGRFQPRVYGRAGCPCPRCGRRIERIIVQQRSAHICPGCQKAPRRLKS